MRRQQRAATIEVDRPQVTTRVSRRRRRTSTASCTRVFLAAAVFQGFLLILQGSFLELGEGTVRNLRKNTDITATQDLVPQQGIPSEVTERSAISNEEESVKTDHKPLDDYFSRNHIARRHENRPPILIVGGSDGSGTRAMVDALGHLGAPILVDDPSTLDVHAETLYKGEGWPPLVRKILNHTFSANYEFADLPSDLQEEVLHEMKTFQEHYNVRAGRLLQAAHKDKKALPSGILFGFKAPVSMLLLPVLVRVYGSVKFVHVVRDGRDVALSSNTSPVDKFFDSFYPDAFDRRISLQDLGNNVTAERLMAMQLWNDWNTQAHHWARKHSDGETFDFLTMRTEDLLSPVTRFDALLQLADFIGSPRSDEEVCCFSQRELEDMGQSAKGSGGKGGNETHRDARQSAFKVRPNPMDRSSWMSQEALPGRIINADAKRTEKNILEQIKSLNDPHAPEQHAYEKIKHNQGPARQRRLLETTSKTTRREEDVIARIQHLRDDSLNARRHFEKQGKRHRPNDSMLEVPEIEKKKEQEKEDILNHISDPATREKFRNFIADRQPTNQKAASPSEVKQRYGKWVGVLKDNPELSKLLHKEGSNGLAVFGYEPSATFLDLNPRALQCQICQE